MLRFNPDLIQFNSEFMTIYAGFITLLYYPNLILNLLIYYDLMLCLLQINS